MFDGPQRGSHCFGTARVFAVLSRAPAGICGRELGDPSRLRELFSDAQVQKGLIPLLNGLDDYIVLRDQATTVDGVISADAARTLQTSVKQVKQFQIALRNFQTSLGSALIPVLGTLAAALRPVLEKLTAIVSQYPVVSGALDAFPDCQSCLNLAARLRHIAGTQWSTKRYMYIRPLLQAEQTQTEAAAAQKNVRKTLDTACCSPSRFRVEVATPSQTHIGAAWPHRSGRA